MENWAPLDGWAKEGELALSVLGEPRLAKGVRGFAFNTPDGIYITAIRAEKPGSGHVSKFLDGLPRNQRVVFPVVVSTKLRAMLLRRGYAEKWEIGEPNQDDVPVMERRSDDERAEPSGARYYDREGRRLSAEEWVVLYEDVTYRCIRSSNIGAYRVSTLYVGIDHNAVESGAPMIFASFVLAKPDARQAPHWTRLEAYTKRYSTERKAREGHEALVKLVCDQQQVDPSCVEEGTGEE